MLVGGVEVHRGGEVLQHLELRVDPSLHRALAQQVAGKGVDRLHARAVQAQQRILEPLLLGPVGRLRPHTSRANRNRADSSAAAFSVKVITPSWSIVARPVRQQSDDAA